MISVSVLIPVHNEAENIGFVIDEIIRHCDALGEYEIIALDDGSTDGTEGVLSRLATEHRCLRVLRHDVRAGKSAAIANAAAVARAQIACTIDGDGQNPARELVPLCRPLLEDGKGVIGLVAGQRVGRKDTAAKRVASRLANALRSRILGDSTRDTACGLKAFRREPFLGLPFFDNMHRYYPALFRRDGWEVRRIDVEDRARRAGTSKYTNAERALVGAVDLLGVAWLMRRKRKARAREAADPPPGRHARDAAPCR